MLGTRFCRFVKPYGSAFIVATSNLLAIPATPIAIQDGTLPASNPCPSPRPSAQQSDQPSPLDRPVLIAIAIPVLIIVLSHVTGCLAYRPHNTILCFYLYIAFLMLYRVVGVALGIVLLILSIVHRHLGVGELGITALLLVYGNPQDTWNAFFKHYILLRHIPFPSLVHSPSEWRRIVRDLVKRATQPDQLHPPSFHDIVLLSFLHSKFAALSPTHFCARYKHPDNDVLTNSVEQQLLSFPHCLHHYRTNVGDWLRRYFISPQYTLVPVPSSPPQTSPVSRETHLRVPPDFPEAPLPSSVRPVESRDLTVENHRIQRAPVHEHPPYTLVNNIHALRILFTIAMFRCIKQGVDGTSSNSQHVARYWELMNRDLSESNDMNWFFDFIHQCYGFVDVHNNAQLPLRDVQNTRPL